MGLLGAKKEILVDRLKSPSVLLREGEDYREMEKDPKRAGLLSIIAALLTPS